MARTPLRRAESRQAGYRHEAAAGGDTSRQVLSGRPGGILGQRGGHQLECAAGVSAGRRHERQMRALWGRMVSCAPVAYRCCAAICKRLRAGYQPAGPRGYPCQPAPQGGTFRHCVMRTSTAALLLLAPSLTAQTNYMQSKLIIVDPGHFHATLLQKDMYPWVDPHVTVYAPLGPDLLDYLNRISLFNSRPDNPTRWALDIHTSSDPMAEMLRGHAGNIVVFTGRNRGKIDRILAALDAGLNVLADKPWIIASADLPKLEEALALAQRKNLAAYDIMTERYEVTSQLQREFVNDPAVFGALEKGSPREPAVHARSIHHLMKVVAGTPLRRPPWFFDIAEYGEGLADVGTHVVDLVQTSARPSELQSLRHL